MISIEVHRLLSLYPSEINIVKKHLREGIKPDSLQPIGTFETVNGFTYWTDRLLGYTSLGHALVVTGTDYTEHLVLHTRSSIQERYLVDKVYPNRLRRVMLHKDDLRVGILGYVLSPHQDIADELRSELTQEPESLNWYNQSIEIQVDLRNHPQRVHLLVLAPLLHQSKLPVGEQFVVIDEHYQILPGRLKFTPQESAVLTHFS